eukprot:1160633-Pelagomonas_calceolata.AAC.12
MSCQIDCAGTYMYALLPAYMHSLPFKFDTASASLYRMRTSTQAHLCWARLNNQQPSKATIR